MKPRAIAAASAALAAAFATAAFAQVYSETTTTYYYTSPAPATTTTYYTVIAQPASFSHRGGSIADKDIAERVASKMSADGGFDGASIEVAVYSGEAQLIGTVRTAEQAQRAGTIAASFVGHNKVMNDLRVSPG